MTLKRILTAAVLIPAVVAIVWWGSTGLVAACVGIITVLALLEFFALGEKANLRGYRLWTCLCALLLLCAQVPYPLINVGPGGYRWVHGQQDATFVSPLFSLTVVLLIFVFGAAGISLVTKRSLADALPALGVSAAALLLVALPFSFVVPIHRFPLLGPKLLLFLLLLVWVGDTAAYFVGRAFGRHPMAPHLSPKKTWEGAAANLLGSILVGAIFARWLTESALISSRRVLLMAALANIAGQMGDLVESAYKRSAGVKDSGTLLPGHGGVLDRIDALILAAPVVWYYFGLVGVRGRWLLW